MRQSPWYESANWIWVADYDDTSAEGKLCLFRRRFQLSEAQTEPCLLRVSADTRYRLYVNNIGVSIGPCKSYPEKWYYETVDIQPFLRKGANTITATVLRFSDKHVGSLSLSRTALPGLIVYCEVQVSSGLTVGCVSHCPADLRTGPHIAHQFRMARRTRQLSADGMPPRMELRLGTTVPGAQRDRRWQETRS
jgi:hypothetical protein